MGMDGAAVGVHVSPLTRGVVGALFAAAWVMCAGCGDIDGESVQSSGDVEVLIDVDGQGVVRGEPDGALSGVVCEGECVEGVRRGSSVVLSAEPAAGYAFVGWSGDCGGAGLCELSATDFRRVTASFRPVCPEPWAALLEGGGGVHVEAVAASPSGEDVVVAGRFMRSLSAERAQGARGLSGPLERVSVVASSDEGVGAFVASFETRRCTLRWLVSLGGASAVTSLVLDESGNAVVGGSFEGTMALGARTVTSAGGRDLFVARLSGARGAVLWSRTFGGVQDEDRSLVSVGRGNTIYWVGRFEGEAMLDDVSTTSAGGQDIFSAVLDQTDGRRRWSQRLGGVGDETPTRLLTTLDGDALLLGDSTGAFVNPERSPSDLRTAFVTRLSARSGAQRWSVELTQEGGEAEEVLATGGAYAVLERGAGGEEVASMVAVGVVGPAGQAIFGVDALTGETQWRTALGGGAPASALEDARPLGPRLVSEARGFVAVTTLADEALLDGMVHSPSGPAELMRVVVTASEGALSSQEFFENEGSVALRGVVRAGEASQVWVGDFEERLSVSGATLSASGRNGFLLLRPPR